MELTALITSISASMEIIKGLNSVENSLNEAELKMKIALLASQLADAKIALSGVQETLNQKDTQISELQKNFEVKSQLVEKYGFQYEADTDGNAKGYPYCDRCIQADGQLFKTVTPPQSKGRDHVICPQCKIEFMGPRAA